MDEPTGATRRRRIRLSGSTHLQAVLIGAATGVALAGRGLRPTGNASVDVVVLAFGVGVAISGACTAHWWALLGGAVVAVALCPLGVGTVLGVVTAAGAVWIGLRHRSVPIARAIVAAGIVFNLSLLGNPWRFGVSSALGVGLTATLALVGWSRRPRADRRLAVRVAATAMTAAGGATALAALGGWLARNQLSEANHYARDGMAELRAARFNTAADRFASAAERFTAANGSLAAPWTQLARLVPGVAQQHRAVTVTSRVAADTSLVLANQTRLVDLESLDFDNGTIDLDAVSALQAPLERVHEAVDQLDTAVATTRSPWLVRPLASRMADLTDMINRQQQLGERALTAIQQAPALLGAEEPRRYFVMFTTPAEARGQGGLMGNYAEITAHRGRIAVTRFGRHNDLNAALEHPVYLDDAPQDWMERFGRYGFRSGADGHVGADPWSLINMSAHFPHTARVITELYPSSGGSELDGVFSLDVYGIEALVGLIGPIRAQGAPILDGSNTATFLLLDQYRSLGDETITETNRTRIDMLGTIADEVMKRLFSSNAPDPLSLVRALGPLASEGRVLAWARRPEEQGLFETVSMAGQVNSGDRGRVLLALNNASGSKIDNFLKVETEIAADRAEVTFTNTAPSRGLPRYVIGSAREDIAIGTSHLIVSAYGTQLPVKVLLNGRPTAVGQSREANREIAEWTLRLPSDTSSTVTLIYPGPVSTVDTSPLAVRRPG